MEYSACIKHVMLDLIVFEVLNYIYWGRDGFIQPL